MRILGIESSCDETGASVVEDGRKLLSNIVASQDDLHGPFGGVVPEVAARAHVERITALVDEAMRVADCTPDDIDALAVVNRPGLVGALLVGISAAKGLALAWNKPLLAIDHIEAHVYAAHLAGFDVYPNLSLIVSGGHTILYRVDAPGRLKILGQTRDDAVGEAFDKVAKMLNLGYPGGPRLSKCAETGDARAIAFPRCGPNEKLSDHFDFSFSGLKTAVYYHLRDPNPKPNEGEANASGRSRKRQRVPLRQADDAEKADIAAAFQEAACEILVEKTLAAARHTGLRAVTVGGGVACNRRLRELFNERATTWDPAASVFFPPPALCTDNAAMIAGLAFHRASAGERDALDLEADPTPKRAEYA